MHLAPLQSARESALFADSDTRSLCWLTGMRRLALTSAASTSPPQQALPRFTRNRPVRSNAGAHNWKPSGALRSQRVRAQRSRETQHCCGSDVRSILAHLHGITLRKPPQMQTEKQPVVCCFWAKGLPHLPYFTVLLHFLLFAMSPPAICFPSPLNWESSPSCNYRVADWVESFCLNVSQNYSDWGSVSQSVQQHRRNCLRIARLVAGFVRSDTIDPRKGRLGSPAVILSVWWWLCTWSSGIVVASCSTCEPLRRTCCGSASWIHTDASPRFLCFAAGQVWCIMNRNHMSCSDPCGQLVWMY